ncbi:hypothetical protein GCM10009114_32440 [Aliiglaciecola litoralis]|uniref:Uncharacterized protein n=1 Tax=Aliiglaciecola litoralis TaxID=582857 RepID=A0ABN1LR93_9ALTE
MNIDKHATDSKPKRLTTTATSDFLNCDAKVISYVPHLLTIYVALIIAFADRLFELPSLIRHYLVAQTGG